MAVGGWAVTFGTTRRAWAIPSSLYQMQQPPINSQFPNFILFDVALYAFGLTAVLLFAAVTACTAVCYAANTGVSAPWDKTTIVNDCHHSSACLADVKPGEFGHIHPVRVRYRPTKDVSNKCNTMVTVHCLTHSLCVSPVCLSVSV